MSLYMALMLFPFIALFRVDHDVSGGDEGNLKIRVIPSARIDRMPPYVDIMVLIPVALVLRFP